jgi:hypothetical protein
MNWLIVFLVAGGALALIFETIVTGVAIFKGQSLLPHWAERNHYLVVQAEVRYWDRGPFLWTTSAIQLVYRVTLQDSHGNSRTAWLAFGGWGLGLFSHKVQVHWEEESPSVRWLRDEEPDLRSGKRSR